jgi:uncharacterized membrane protein
MANKTHISHFFLGGFFIAAGLMHFVATEDYVAMMPVYLPWHEGLVVLSGILEIAGGIGVLLPAQRRVAGIGLIVLLVAVFPANVHVAVHQLPIGETYLTPAFLWARLPLQLGFLYWVAHQTLFTEAREESEFYG